MRGKAGRYQSFLSYNLVVAHYLPTLPEREHIEAVLSKHPQETDFAIEIFRNRLRAADHHGELQYWTYDPQSKKKPTRKVNQVQLKVTKDWITLKIDSAIAHEFPNEPLTASIPINPPRGTGRPSTFKKIAVIALIHHHYTKRSWSELARIFCKTSAQKRSLNPEIARLKRLMKKYGVSLS
jgi:hypothetical protein